MWLIYALGGGWGHLTRAVALGRIAQRDRPVRILTNSPYAGMVGPTLSGRGPASSRLTGGSACPTNVLDIVAVDARATAEETRAAVTREIAESRPSCLIVDTFPRGIGGELAGLLGKLDAPKVLVQRDLNPRYVAAARLREFVTAHYDLVLVPGAEALGPESNGLGPEYGDRLRCPRGPKTGPWDSEACHHILTDPWLVRCAGEIPDRERAMETLRLEGDEERCVLVCASGRAAELEWYGAVVAELIERSVAVRCVSAECPPRCPEEFWVRYWPAMDLFGCAAVVVGGAGYNTVEECLAWKVPLVARPWPRLYDRQELRAQKASARGCVIVVKEAEEAARAAIEQFGNAPAGPPEFVNGAVVACTTGILACVG